MLWGSPGSGRASQEQRGSGGGPGLRWAGHSTSEPWYRPCPCHLIPSPARRRRRGVLEKPWQTGCSCAPGALHVGWTPSTWRRHSSRAGEAAQALRDFEQLAWQFAPYCIYKHWGNLNASPRRFRSSHPQQNRRAGRSCAALPHLRDNLLKTEKKGALINPCGISILHGVQIPSQTAHPITDAWTPPWRLGREVTRQPMTSAAHHPLATTRGRAEDTHAMSPG